MEETNVFEDIDPKYKEEKRRQLLKKQLIKNRFSKIAAIKNKIKNNTKSIKIPKINIPLPSAPSRVVIRQAATRVNVLSHYNNEKFYPRKKVQKESYLGRYSFR